MMDAGDLDRALKAAGIPIVGVILKRSPKDREPAECVVQYDPTATAQQIIDGDALAASFDWSAERPAEKTIEEEIADLKRDVGALKGKP